MTKKILFLALCWLFAANTATPYVLYPFYMDIPVLHPGHSIECTFTMKGTIDEETLQFSATDIYTSPEGRRQYIRMDSLPYSAVPWVSGLPEQVTVKKGETKEITFTITAPQHAQAGVYYTSIFVRPINYFSARLSDNAVIDLGGTVSLNVSVNISGRTYPKQGLVVDSLELVPQDNYTLVLATFKNTSKDRLTVSGNATIAHAKKHFGYGDIILYPMGAGKDTPEATVFPGATRHYVGYLNRPLSPGAYNVRTSFHYGDSYRTANKAQPCIIPGTEMVNDSLFDAKTAFLFLRETEGSLVLQENASRAFPVVLENADMDRPLSVELTSSAPWAKPTATVELRPGQRRSIIVRIAAPSYDESQVAQATIALKPERGLPEELHLVIAPDEDILKDYYNNLKRKNK